MYLKGDKNELSPRLVIVAQPKCGISLQQSVLHGDE